VGREYAIEPDATAATYFWAAAALTAGRVTVEGLSRGSAQGDVGFVDVLAAMGCRVESSPTGLMVRGPERLRGIDVDLNAMPDTALTLAVLALYADGVTTIRNVANLRVKETDRLAALATELRKFGAEVVEGPDRLEIAPPEEPRAAEVATYDDHRMAMSFALAGLRTEGVTISGAECVSKTFPDYFECLRKLVNKG
jgi:3-phosphoshikimate 1-carboxyvinyltransferase